MDWIGDGEKNMIMLLGTLQKMITKKQQEH